MGGRHSWTNGKCFLPLGCTRWAEQSAISFTPAKRNHLAQSLEAHKQVSLSARSSRCLLLPWWPLKYASPSDFSFKPNIKSHQYRGVWRNGKRERKKWKMLKRNHKIIQVAHSQWCFSYPGIINWDSCYQKLFLPNSIQFMKTFIFQVAEQTNTIFHSGMSGQSDRVGQKACKSREDSLLAQRQKIKTTS